nr:MAG TPA: hypothetical protein [Caudoviricetes sp.]
MTFLCPYELVLYSTNLSRVDRASTTAHRQRSLFPFGILLGSLDPIIEITRSGDLNFRHKKTAMLSGADSRYEFVVQLSYPLMAVFVKLNCKSFHNGLFVAFNSISKAIIII